MEKDSKPENKSKLAEEFQSLLSDGTKLDNSSAINLLNEILSRHCEEERRSNLLIEIATPAEEHRLGSQ